MRETVRRLDALPVKGKVEEVEVHELLWQTSSERTVIPGRAAPVSTPGGGPRIKLVHRGKELTFKDTIYFGREAAGNNIVIAGPMTSRQHAKIELRGGKFVLVDLSSNGTFVTLGNNAEMRLRREEAILYGSGIIALGQSAAAAGDDVVEFHCNPR
jgi:pSer/pThr/pTyr-binding forkhead associated (FHA) protein